MAKPFISIYLCNYNHAKYLPQCIAGFQQQTFKDFEVLITDDGSTDYSQKIIAKAAVSDPRLKPKYFKKNQGLMASTKDTLERASGTYIFGEAADDFIIDKFFLERVVTAFRAHTTSAGFFGLAGLLAAEKNEVTGKMGSASREGYIPPRVMLSRDIAWVNVCA